jgi:release factor glutamine methyltransferase
MPTRPPDSPDEPDDGSVPWRSFRREAERRLRAAGFDSPETDARRIVEQASGFEGADHVLGLDEPATERGVAQFDQMLNRRLAGEPLQYVVGSWGFRELDLLVDRRVLIPRPETEVVVDHALAELDRIRSRTGGRAVVVDLGTGSGAIALSFAHERDRVEVWATDVSADALAVARANLAGLGRSATRVRLAQGSWFAALPDDLRGGVDLVVSNPPYVARSDVLPQEVSEWEPSASLVAGPKGTEALEILIREAPGWLAPHGVMVLEIAPHQGAPMLELAEAAGFSAARVEPDLAGRDRALVLRLTGSS